MNIIKEIYNTQNGNVFRYEYYIAYQELLKIAKDFNKFPTIREWTKYAKEKQLISAVALEYVSNLDWHKLRDKVFTEINSKKN